MTYLKYIVRILFTVVCLYLSLLNGIGQEILSNERVKEIKTSGRYYFDECFDLDEDDARACAIMDLTQKVLVALVQQSIKTDEKEMIKTVEIRAKTAPVSLAGGAIILAWIEKENILINQTPEPTPKPILVSEPEKEPEPIQEPEKVSEPKPQPEPVQEPESIAEPPSNHDLSVITNPVIRDLATCETYDQFRRMADRYNRQGKLTDGNKNRFFDPDHCLIAVFSPARKLIALLDAGQGNRTDLLTGKTIQNAEQHFAGNILFWININN